MRITGIGAPLLAGALAAGVAAAADLKERAKLTASDGALEQYFGRSVALQGDALLVGADGDGQIGRQAGAAYVFHEIGSGWTQTAKLLDPTGRSFDFFGRSVCFTGSGLAAVGVPDTNGPGSFFSAGSVQLFNPIIGWAQWEKLLASPSINGQLGWEIGCSGDRVIGGAPFTDGTFQHEGSFAIFGVEGFGWRQEAFFRPPFPVYQGYLGISVAIDGDDAVVSATGREPHFVRFYRRGSTGWTLVDEIEGLSLHNLNLAGDLLVGSGPVMENVAVYRRIDGEWTEEVRLQSDQPTNFNAFGQAVALSGDRIAVSEMYSDRAGPNRGAVHVFRYDGQDWQRERVLVASDSSADPRFGVSLALEGKRVAVGDVFDDDAGTKAGAVYVFQISREIAIDPWPYWADNVVNPASTGMIPLALLGSASFDPEDADDATLALGRNGAPSLHVYESRDVNGDGHLDRVFLFRVSETGIRLGDTQVCLTGSTLAGDDVDGCAPIVTIQGCGRGQQLAWALPAVLLLRRRFVRRKR